MRNLIRSLVGPAVEASVIASAELWGELPLPDDAAHVYAMGPNAHRILLFGAGGIAGLGVSSHEVAVGGQLARRLAAMTGRGVDIEIDGVLSRSLSRSTQDLAQHDLSRFDALVIQLGAREGVGLRSASAWRRDMREFVAAIESAAPIGLEVFFFGLPAMPGVVEMPAMLEAVVNRHLARLDAQSRAACAGSRVRFIHFAPRDAPLGSRYGGASTHAGWAEAMAVAIATPLSRATEVVRELIPDDEDLRIASLRELVDTDRSDDTRFDAMVAMARDLFGVAGAALNFIDSHCQWTYAGAGIPRGFVPRSGTFCTAAIARDEIYVVPDTDLDPRWVHHSNGEGAGRIRFYAGYPIEAPNGQRIGTLCIIDVVPRRFSIEDAALLRELALRVQSALWAVRPRSSAR